MKRKAMFCCDASRDMYEDYYANQRGDGMPVFVGARRQRGHSLGNIFGGLLRNVLVPIATSAMKLGIDVAGDMARGKTFGESAQKHVPKGIKEAAEGIVWQKRSRKPICKRPTYLNSTCDGFNSRAVV